ncbi:hypothetical protein CEXT_94631 [Caerostris extrusa]|uniref:Uncharacterized protein n=1 Tax=Caerostris extrusa TaxID=172846 RepID=A0AAV4NRC0_CAEEX|nr:hypothetical protein CEXT_94631 [Caerostris extrusa]
MRKACIFYGDVNQAVAGCDFMWQDSANKALAETLKSTYICHTDSIKQTYTGLMRRICRRPKSMHVTLSMILINEPFFDNRCIEELIIALEGTGTFAKI